jgi:hypothetical protein
MELEQEILNAENKVQELEGVVAGVQSPHPLNNAQVLEDLE